MTDKELYFYGTLYSNCYLGPGRSKYAARNTWIAPGKFSRINRYHKFLTKEKRNVVLCPDVEEIPHFEKAAIINDNETVRQLNKKGLHIYFWEPLTIYGVPGNPLTKSSNPLTHRITEASKKITSWLPVTAEGNIINDTFTVSGENNKRLSIRAVELDSIEKFAAANDLNNITVYCLDANTENTLGKTYPRIKLQRTMIGRSYILPDNIPEEPDDFQFTKKFWNGNWRYSAHRHIIASHLVNNFPIDHLNLSWVRPSSENLLIENLYHTHLKFDEYWPGLAAGAERLNELAPLAMGLDVSEVYELHEKVEVGVDHSNPMAHYQEAFCAIVTETKYAQPFASMTEKTIYPFMNQRPFISVAAPYHLSLLRAYGFETFSDWWDESYDTEEDPYVRMKLILKLINDIGSMSLDEMQDMYEDMKPTLIKNKEIILEYEKRHVLDYEKYHRRGMKYEDC